MSNPYEQVLWSKRALLDDAASGPTGVEPADRAIAFVRRHPMVVTAALAGCGVIVATSPMARLGLRRMAALSLKGLATGMMLKKLGD